MSEQFTLYRGESGAPYLVAFRCAHRQTQLSVGWIENDCIRCRYHGWKYDGAGQCVEQPDEAIPFPGKVGIRACPATEYLGLIFAYLGDGEPPPLRRFPAFEREGILKVGPLETWPCNFFNRCENTMDAVHVNFTHLATRKRLNLTNVQHRVPGSADETDYGILHYFVLDDGREIRNDFYMPNVSYVRPSGRVEGTKDDAKAVSPDRLFFYVPIDDENSTTFVIDFLPLTGAAAASYRDRAMRDRARMEMSASEIGAAILAGRMSFDDIDPEMSSYYSYWIEDYVTLVGQGAIPDRGEDRLGRTDRGVILLRKIWERELTALERQGPVKQWA
jgi:5,5'-dehydrodivanillate O-demethylase